MPETWPILSKSCIDAVLFSFNLVEPNIGHCTTQYNILPSHFIKIICKTCLNKHQLAKVYSWFVGSTGKVKKLQASVRVYVIDTKKLAGIVISRYCRNVK
jgi:hypothetical protein